MAHLGLDAVQVALVHDVGDGLGDVKAAADLLDLLLLCCSWCCDLGDIAEEHLLGLLGLDDLLVQGVHLGVDFALAGLLLGVEVALLGSRQVHDLLELINELGPPRWWAFFVLESERSW